MESTLDDVSHKLQISYRLLFERNPLPMWVYDVKTLRMLAVNAAALAQYGYSKQEFVGLTLLDLHYEGDIAQLNEHLKLSISKQPATRLWRHKHRNGDLIEVEMVTEELELDGLHASMALVRDLTEQRRSEQEKHDLAQRLAITLESITDAFFTLDLDRRFTYVNSQAEAFFSARRDDLLGCGVPEKLPESVRTVFQRECDRALAESNKVNFELYCASLGLWLEADVYPSALGLAVYFRDVSEKHAADQCLLEKRETLAAVINSTNNAVISTGQEGLIKIFNPGAERIFRRTRESMQGQPLELLLPERFRATHAQHLRSFGESPGSSRMMGLGLVKGLRSDGQEIDLEATITQVTVNQKLILIVNLKDVSERVRTEAESEQSRLQLSELTKRLMTQEKTLVKRVAQALHDQLGQTMAAIRMAHETIMTLQRDKATSGIDRLQAQMGKLISQGIRQVRQVLVDLRPPLLEEHGLAAALDNELRNRSLTQPQIDISISVKPEIASLRWPSEVEYAAFMVAREAIENSLRHSGATSLSVSLYGEALSLHLEVSDNGIGIAPGGMQKTGHLGILSMQERAHTVGATVTIDSGEAYGTSVSFSWQPTP
ncbi:MAG: PAS domain S-box protein [Rhodoferax sp.]|uniref:sensor histidine kinase n=1 Tax=Rhodoferax sp. TaxID=50421 RepID=UPI0017D80506|nr:PAS domain S-box protein [Rhodoferax sp.]NMM21486.1 PAS domain S-box protein [Rhodoferax sp.]